MLLSWVWLPLYWKPQWGVCAGAGHLAIALELVGFALSLTIIHLCRPKRANSLLINLGCI